MYWWSVNELRWFWKDVTLFKRVVWFNLTQPVSVCRSLQHWLRCRPSQLPASSQLCPPGCLPWRWSCRTDGVPDSLPLSASLRLECKKDNKKKFHKVAQQKYCFANFFKGILAGTRFLLSNIFLYLEHFCAYVIFLCLEHFLCLQAL